MSDNDLLLGKIDGKLDTVLERLDKIEGNVPVECAVHKVKLSALERSNLRLWICVVLLMAIALGMGGKPALALILSHLPAMVVRLPF